MSSAPLSSPFVGLVPYDKASSDYFCGRDRESTLVTAAVGSSRVTLVYGPSGCGKSSILCAAVIPKLEASPRKPIVALVRSEWKTGAFPAIQHAIDAARPGEGLAFPDSWLGETAETAPKLFLILDQFEDLFFHHPKLVPASQSEILKLADEMSASGYTREETPDAPPGMRQAAALVALLSHPNSPVNILMSIRDDCIGQLDVFKGLIPGLFDTLLRIEPFDENSLRSFIPEVLDRWHKETGSLIHTPPGQDGKSVLDLLASDDALLTADSARRKGTAERRFETPFLQMALERLWKEDVLAGYPEGKVPAGKTAGLKAATYISLKGARGIRKDFVQDALKKILPDGDPSKILFLNASRFLVSKTRKFPWSCQDLAKEMLDEGCDTGSIRAPDALASELLRIFTLFEKTRLMIRIPHIDEGYEVTHDSLAGEIYDWRREQQKLLDEVEKVREIERQELIAKNSLEEKKREEARINGALKLARKSRNWAACIGCISVLSGFAVAAWGWRNARVKIALADQEVKVETARAKEEAQTKIREANEEAGRKLDEAKKLADEEKRQLAEEKKQLAEENTSLKEDKTRTDEAFAKTQEELKSKQEEISEANRILDDALKASSQRKNLNAIASQLDQITRQPTTPGDPALKELVAIWKGQTPAVPPSEEVHGLVARLKGHEGDINQAAFSPDGKWIATAGQDKYLKIWKIENHSAPAISSKVASASKGGVQTVAIAPDNRSVATGSSGQSIRLFQLGTDGKLGKVVEWSQPTDNTVTRLTFLPGTTPNDAFRLAASYANGVAKLLQVKNGTVSWMDDGMRTNPWKNRSGKSVTWISTNSDQTKAVTSSDDGNISVWNMIPPYGLAPDSLVGNPANCEAPTRRVIFSPTDSSLVVGGAGNKVAFWRVGSGQILRLLDSGNAGTQHDGGVWQVAFDPTGGRFASIGTDGRCIVWTVPNDPAAVPSGLILATQLKGRLLAVDWNHKGLVIGAEDGHVEIWKLPSGDTPALLTNFPAHDGAVWGITFSQDEKQLLTWSGTDRDSGNLPSPRGAALDYVLLNRIHSDGTAAVWDLEKMIQESRGR